jgi:phosphoinositide-3-kinase regulatory subunit 4
MKTSPFQNWGVFTSSRVQNETSLWNLETGSRDLCLWASPQPPLTKPTESPMMGALGKQPYSILGMTFVKSYNAVITGGTDMCVRWWDMTSPADSYLLVSPDKAEQHINGIHRTGVYASRLVDGIEVIHDITGNKNVGIGSASSPVTNVNKIGSDAASISSSGSNTSGTLNAAAMGNAHHNSISDVATVSTPNQSYILTSSYDGVVKVWK